MPGGGVVGAQVRDEREAWDFNRFRAEISSMLSDEFPVLKITDWTSVTDRAQQVVNTDVVIAIGQIVPLDIFAQKPDRTIGHGKMSAPRVLAAECD